MKNVDCIRQEGADSEAALRKSYKKADNTKNTIMY